MGDGRAAGRGLEFGLRPHGIRGAGVGTGYKVHRDERTAGQQIDDTTGASRVKLSLAGERGVPARRIDVDVVEGVVHLSGFVASKEIRQRAGEIVAEEDGAREVRNNLQVGTRIWGEALADRRAGARVKFEQKRGRSRLASPR